MTIDSILVSDDSFDTPLVAVANDTSQEEARKQQTTIDFKMVTFSLYGKELPRML